MLCAQPVVGFFFNVKETDDELHRVYQGFLELSGAVQVPGNSLFQLFIFFMAHLSAGEGQRAARIPDLIAGIFL